MKFRGLFAAAAFVISPVMAGSVGVWSGISTAGTPNWTVVSNGSQSKLFEKDSTGGYPVAEYSGGDRDGFIRERGGATFRYWQGALYAGNGTTEKLCDLQNDREIWVNGKRLGRFDIGNEGRFDGAGTYTWKGGVIPMPMRVYLAAVRYCGIRKGVKSAAAAKAAAANGGPAKKTEGPVFKVYAGEASAGKVFRTYRDRQLWKGESVKDAPETTLEWKSWSFFAGAATSGTALYTFSKGRFLRGAADSGEVLLSVDGSTLVVSRHSAAGVEPVGKWDSRDFAVFRDMSGRVLMSVLPVTASGSRMDVPSKYYSLWKILEGKSE